MAAVEDAGATVHTQRNALDSGYSFTIGGGSGAPDVVRFIAGGRDASATLDASFGGFGKNEDDNEITGIHLSDGDPSVGGLIGTDNPRFLTRGDGDHGSDDWRLFWTQQHGDNTTWEVLLDPH